MKILKAGRFYDIFFGEGWYNHTRIQIKSTPKGKRIYHVSGNVLNRNQCIIIGKHIL